MNMQPNAYELNKDYRREQESRSERQRLADAAQSKQEKPQPSILVQLLTVLK
jgi:hypothetical protein